MKRVGMVCALAGAMGLFGCSNEDVAPVGGGCAAEDQIGGVCAGVPASAVCRSESCTSGVECSSTVEVADSSALTSAAAAATAGTCIALHAGSYGAVTVPGGVSLLGKSAAAVKVAGVILGAGDGAVLRGLGVGSGGVKLDGATNVRLEAVRISGSSGAGLDVGGGKVTVTSSTIEGSTTYGVVAGDGADVSIDGSVVAGGQGPGVWVACAQGCSCASQPMLSATGSIVRDNRIAGINLVGAAASLTGNDVKGTKPGDAWHYGQFGGGVSASECSNVVLSGGSVAHNKSFGVLVDDSSAKLGGPAATDTLAVSDNMMGVWIQNIPASGQGVHVDHTTVEGNQGVGIGVGGTTVGIIIICRTAVNGTTKTLLPVYENAMDLGSAKEVGDGLNWLNGAELQLDEVTFSGNERASLLIDGPAKGTLSNVTLSGGDEAKGIVEQNYMAGEQPEVSAGTPALTTSATEIFSVPKAPVLAGKL